MQLLIKHKRILAGRFARVQLLGIERALSYLPCCISHCLRPKMNCSFAYNKVAAFDWVLWFLGAFAKLWIATIRYVMSVCLSVCPSARPHGTTRLALDGFSWKLIFVYFRKSVQKIPTLLKSDKNNGCFTWRPTYSYDNISLSSY
jgi:hypothetical protein